MALAGVSTAKSWGFRGGRIGEHCCPASHLPSAVIKMQVRANTAATPRNPLTGDVGSSHRRRFSWYGCDPKRFTSPVAKFYDAAAMPIGRIGRPSRIAADFRGRSVPARRKDTWWRGWLRARACRKHRAGSGPLPRQIRPTPQRRRCGRGRGRGPAGRSGRTDAARRSIPRA